MASESDLIMHKGAILQRDKKTYAIVPRIQCGILTSEILDNFSRVVKKFNIPTVKIIAGERIALLGIQSEDIDPIWEELGMEMSHAKGLCFHFVQTCPGDDWCKYGVDDSMSMGLELEEMFHETVFPAKLKFGVSGCTMCCGGSYIRDIGVIGTRKGWTMAIGGRAGSNPQTGIILQEHMSKTEVVSLIQKFLKYYVENALNKERVYRFVKRVGFENVKREMPGENSE